MTEPIVRGSIRVERAPSGNVTVSMLVHAGDNLRDLDLGPVEIQRGDVEDVIAALTAVADPNELAKRALYANLAQTTPSTANTVYAHVERTVHALLENIEVRLDSIGNDGDAAADVKTFAEAVQALSSWPQFNPMNSHERYQQLAEYAVEKAVKAYQDSPKMPACDCGVGVKFGAGFHREGCKGFLYPEVKTP